MERYDELDALICSKLFGLDTFKDQHGYWNVRDGHLFPYSSDMTYAWHVVRYLTCKGYKFEVHNHCTKDEWCALFWKDNKPDLFEGLASDAAMAICKAALDTCAPKKKIKNARKRTKK